MLNQLIILTDYFVVSILCLNIKIKINCWTITCKTFKIIIHFTKIHFKTYGGIVVTQLTMTHTSFQFMAQGKKYVILEATIPPAIILFSTRTHTYFLLEKEVVSYNNIYKDQYFIYVFSTH